MGNGKAKIELLLEMKNRIRTGLKQAKEKLGRGVNEMKDKLRSLRASHVEAFSAMRAEIPLLDRAMKLLGNPYVLATAGLVGLFALLGKGTNEAAKFNHEFLQIKQLNLDKPQEQMEAYKKTIYDVAMSTGLAATDTAKAFYDIQSGTGLFGKDVAEITKEVGKFSIATGAELPDSVNQTIKAMKAFNLPASEVRNLLESNAKTVQVGITTFAELAKVQTEYAGAAAGAGQTIDTANKVFAAFTSIAKDSNTAATMTKAAFEGLTQKNTVKGLDSIGVSLYDSTGNMRDLSAVLGEVSAKFKTMSPKQIDELINKIGGPEGLRNMFVKLKTGSEDFFATLEAYDNSKFNLDKALKNAQGDFVTLKKIVGNQFNTVMAQLGEKILPIVARLFQKISDILTYAYDNWDQISSAISTAATVIGGAILVWKAWTTAQWALNAAMAANPIGLIIVAIGAVVMAIIQLVKHTEGWAESWQAAKTILTATWEQAKLNFGHLKDSIVYGLKLMLLKFKHFGQYIKELFSNIGKSISLAFQGDFKGAKEALKAKITTQASQDIEALKAEHVKNQMEFLKATNTNVKAIKDAWGKIGIRKKQGAEETDEQGNPLAAGSPSFLGSGSAPGSGGSNGSGGGESFGSGINKIVGSAKQIRNITVHIGSLIGGINTENTILEGKSESEIEQIITEICLRAIRNIETSY